MNMTSNAVFVYDPVIFFRLEVSVKCIFNGSVCTGEEEKSGNKENASKKYFH